MTLRASLLAAALCVCAVHAHAENLGENFVHPPASARPRVWWHWLDGNVSQDGIAKDLAWMQRVGIGGFQLFNASLGLPKLVPLPVRYGSPQWRALVGFAASEAARLGLEMTVTAGPGWSESGGPWVQPAQAMKKLVWSETVLEPGRPGPIRLAPPPTVSGPFQDAPAPAPFSLGPPAPTPLLPEFYADVAVVALPIQPADVLIDTLAPVVSSSAGRIDAAVLHDGHFSRAENLPLPKDGGPAWIQYQFPTPTTIRAVTLALDFISVNSPGLPAATLQVSDDGANFRALASLGAPDLKKPLPPAYPVVTIALPPVRARYYRVVLPRPGPPAFALGPTTPVTAYRVTEFALHPGARLNRFEAKAGTMVSFDYAGLGAPAGADASATPPADVIDLTAKMRADGTLDWTPKPGRWRVLRFGYSLTGVENHPATVEATGLEVDKLDPQAVRAYIAGAMAPFTAAIGKNPLGGILNDSWEAGTANWTAAMPAEFLRRRGYAMTKFLPAIAGFPVGSQQQSDRFLWDFRRTIAEMLAESHYKTIADYAHAHGLRYFAEATGPNSPTLADGLYSKSFVDVPMGEYWQQPGNPPEPGFGADVIEAASASHLYGKPIAAAESFTALPDNPPFSATPASLQPVADQIFADGINSISIHTSPHQPTDRAPGVTLGPFGQYFSRNEAWAELAGGWTDYLARCSFLLQQGRFAADVAYFYGQGATATVPPLDTLDPVLPKNYATDFVGEDAILNLLRVENGVLVTQSGMRYRLLVLPAQLDRLTLPVLKKLASLVRQGAVLLGTKTVASPSLADDDAAIGHIAGALWGNTSAAPHRYGKGRVYTGLSIADVLAAEHVAPDATYSGDSAKAIAWIHRHLDTADLWFVANKTTQPQDFEGTFQITGRAPELWHPITGGTEPVSYSSTDGRTTVHLHLDPYDAVFVVFRSHGTASRTVRTPRQTELATLDGGWDVHFQRDRGAPESAHFDRLGSLTDRTDPGIRYFSGIATYSRDVSVSAMPPRARLLLDLGRVGEVARISVNGNTAGIVWRAPFRLDITALVRPGENHLSIEVADLWPNRIIGDLQPGTSTKIAFSTFPFAAYRASTVLTRSGLQGPVRLIEVR